MICVNVGKQSRNHLGFVNGFECQICADNRSENLLKEKNFLEYNGKKDILNRNDFHTLRNVRQFNVVMPCPSYSSCF